MGVGGIGNSGSNLPKEGEPKEKGNTIFKNGKLVTGALCALVRSSQSITPKYLILSSEVGYGFSPQEVKRQVHNVLTDGPIIDQATPLQYLASLNQEWCEDFFKELTVYSQEIQERCWVFLSFKKPVEELKKEVEKGIYDSIPSGKEIAEFIMSGKRK